LTQKNISPPAKEAGQVIQPVSNWEQAYGSHFSNPEWQQRLAWFQSLKEPVALSWLYGLQFILQPGEHLSRILCTTGQYEPNTMLVLHDYLIPGGVFIDVGANVGAFSLVAARLVGPQGRVIAYEPSPREFGRLAMQIEMNQLAQVTLRQAGLAEQPGMAMLHLADVHSSGLNTLASRFVYQDTVSGGNCEVKLATLDDEAKSLNLARLDMLKIDVEGWETQVLMGARGTLARFRPILIIEVLQLALKDSGSSVEALEYWLHEFGYVFFRIDNCTGERVRVNTLKDCNQENVVAMPKERCP
jgi:FkbM family methyltransferase